MNESEYVWFITFHDENEKKIKCTKTATKAYDLCREYIKKRFKHCNPENYYNYLYKSFLRNPNEFDCGFICSVKRIYVD